MEALPRQSRVVKFGIFEADLETGELRKSGMRQKLAGQPFQVLQVLLEHPQEVVTREQLQKYLWPDSVVVNYDLALKKAVNRIREVLGDSAESPRYIETLPRRGYRFIAQVEVIPNGHGPVAKVVDIRIHATDSAMPPEPLPTEASHDSVPPSKLHRRKYAVALVIILVSICGALAWLFRPRAPVVTAIRQLTRDGLPKSARFGPKTDGTRLYFDVFTGGKFHTGQISTQGGDVSYLDLPMIGEPFVHGISDDGSQLEIFDEPVDLGQSTFWLVALPEGPARRIPGNYPWAKILPGGTEMVYLQSSDLRHLYRARLDGSDPRAVVTLPAEADSFHGVDISPDGQRTRFTTIDGQTWESNLDGRGMRRFLPNFAKPMCCGQWSRDGKLYIFASREEGVENLWAVNESGWSRFLHQRQAVQLTSGPISFSIGTPSNDGKQIFTIGAIQRGELSVYDSKTGDFRPYLNGISGGFTDFSRDGQWVAYVSHPQGHLWRSRMDGSERLQLTFSPIDGVMNPRWAPDGRSVVFMEVGDTGRKIYLVSADGGTPSLLLSGDFQPSDPTWSPDGKSIAYGGVPSSLPGHPAPTEIRILDLQTKQSRTIPGSQGFFGPRWSPDGRFIAAQSEDEQHLWLYSFDDNRWRELPTPKPAKWDSVGWAAWSHDSQYLYFLKRVNIYKVRIPDGPHELVASADGLDIMCPVFPWVTWFGLTLDDRPLVLLDRGSTELYALDYR